MKYKNFLYFQQLIAISKPLELVQNAILKNIAILEENPLDEDPTFVAIQEVLELNRSAEKGLRDRLFVLTVANQDGWKVAANVAKRKAGVVEDEDYVAAKREVGSAARKTPEKDKYSPSGKNGRGRQSSGYGKRGYDSSHQSGPSLVPALAGPGYTPAAMPLSFGPSQPYGFVQSYGQQQWPGYGLTNTGPMATQTGFSASQMPLLPPPPPPVITPNRGKPKRCFVCDSETHMSPQCPTRQK
jgi:hypothetical protein